MTIPTWTQEYLRREHSPQKSGWRQTGQFSRPTPGGNWTARTATWRNRHWHRFARWPGRSPGLGRSSTARPRASIRARHSSRFAELAKGVRSFARCLEGPLPPASKAGQVRRFPTPVCPASLTLPSMPPIRWGKSCCLNPRFPSTSGSRPSTPCPLRSRPERPAGRDHAILSYATTRRRHLRSRSPGYSKTSSGATGRRANRSATSITSIESEALSGVVMRSVGVPFDSEQWGTIALSTYQANEATITATSRLGRQIVVRAAARFLGRLHCRRRSRRPRAWRQDLPRSAASAIARRFLPVRNGPSRSWSPGTSRTARTGNRATPRRRSRDNGSATTTPPNADDAWDVATWVSRECRRTRSATPSTSSPHSVPRRCRRSSRKPPSSTSAPCAPKPHSAPKTATSSAGRAARTTRGRATAAAPTSGTTSRAPPILFGSLARSMREVEFLHATDDDGLMSFRVEPAAASTQQHMVWPLPTGKWAA